VAPAHAAGAVDVTVTNPDGQTADLPGGFTYTTAAFTILPAVGSTAGGTTVTLTGNSFQTGATVSFGGVVVTPVSVSAPLQITAKTPPRSASGLVDVIVKNPDGTQLTVSQGFDYEPAPTTVFISTGFEDGTQGGFGTNGSSVTVTTEAAHTGTQSVKCAGTHSELQFGYGTNPPVTETNGLYQRWYQMVLAETITDSASGQIKMLLNRLNSGSGQPGWLMNGIGSQFNSNPEGEYTAYQDSNVVKLPGTHTHVVLQPLQWYEIETWFKRVNGIGYVKLWIDGQLKMETSSSAMGSDLPGDSLTWRFGISYTQGTSGPLVMYLDDAEAANGFIEAVP
jgi:hypothetical protein